MTTKTHAAAAYHEEGNILTGCPNCGDDHCTGICDAVATTLTTIHRFVTNPGTPLRSVAYAFVNDRGESFTLHEGCWGNRGAVRLLVLDSVEYYIFPPHERGDKPALTIHSKDGVTFVAQQVTSHTIWYSRGCKWLGVRGKHSESSSSVVFGQNGPQGWMNGREVHGLVQAESFVSYESRQHGSELHGFDRLFDYGSGLPLHEPY